MTPKRFAVPEAKIIKLTQDRIAQGQSQLVDVIKTLVYKTAPSIFDLLNYDDDETFLEPFLFSWFTANEPCVPLEQILFGYIIPAKRPADIQVYADVNGIIYLPRLGYLFTHLSNEHLSLSWAGLPTNFVLQYRKVVIGYKFENILWAKDTSIEICRTTHPMLNRFFIDDKNEAVHVEVSDITRDHIQHLNNAFEIIQSTQPQYYKDILAVTRKIVIYKGAKPNSFATLSAHGTAFVNADTHDDEVFFVEDLVHQCGHVIFNAIAFDKKALLEVDPGTPLREFTGIKQESRTILDTLHGIFTETAMCQCFDICYENHVFPSRQEHELLGRFAYILKRFNCDLQNLAHRQIFTDNGFLLYRWYLSVFDGLYQKRGDLLRELKIANQPYKFSYEKFAALNPIGSTCG